MPDIGTSILARWGRPLRTLALSAAVGAMVMSGALVASDEADAPSTRPLSASQRVDLYTPVFSHPTHITNPLFPISRQRQVVQLGHEADEALRNEITTLPEIREVEWNGRTMETVVSQFVAYGDGRILESALDYFAQDDRGAVWYFGEDVDNYIDGVLDNHDGTWLAGRDGPPGMIMPAHPRIGDRYRPENIPGLVFEEVTVKGVDQTVRGPRGPVRGAILVQERQLDGALEDKFFAPGYGEFDAVVATEDEHVRVAIAHPTDRLGPPVPQELWTLSSGARRIFETAPGRDWGSLSADGRRVAAAWARQRTRAVPPLLGPPTDRAIADLQVALSERNLSDVRQAAVDLAHAAFDLQTQHRDPIGIDRDRTQVWKRQLLLDGRADDLAGIDSDLVVLELIDDRLERGTDD